MVVKVNMKKAIEIHKDILRKERELIFPELDREYIIASEKNDEEKVSKILKDKNFYRDITDLKIVNEAANTTVLMQLKLNNLENIRKDIENNLIKK